MSVQRGCWEPAGVLFVQAGQAIRVLSKQLCRTQVSSLIRLPRQLIGYWRRTKNTSAFRNAHCIIGGLSETSRRNAWCIGQIPVERTKVDLLEASVTRLHYAFGSRM